MQPLMTMVHVSHTSRTFVSCLILLAWCGLLSGATGVWYHVVEKSPERLLLQVDPPAVPLDTLSAASGPLIRFRTGAPLLQDLALPALPVQTLLLDWPVASLSLRVISEQPDTTIVIAPLACSVDAPVTGEAVPTAQWQRENRSGPAVAAEIVALGRSGRQNLWLLRVFPCRYDAAAHTLTRIASLRLELSGAGTRPALVRPGTAAAMGDLSFAGAAAQLSAAGAVGESFAAPGHIKMSVDEDGWYKVSGAALRKAGLDLLRIDVKRLRLSCGGTAVPFYFHGDGDSEMEAGESIEFYGTGLRLNAPAATPDLYQDPYSSTNVYWLGWDGEAGPRMEEEYSESAAASGQTPQIPYSFYQTVHVEQDNFFEHFDGIAFPDSLRDHWLYDSGISAGSKRSYPFALYAPDAGSLLPVQVRVMLTGRTLTNKELHQASVYLNDRFAARGSGERQGLLDLRSRDENGLLAAALNSSANTLTVVNEFDPARTDYIALNWFDVTYPRLYRAEGGWLEFTIPADKQPGLFHFSLEGFADATVEIYKLGVSRIIGAAMAEATGSDGRRSVRAEFFDTAPSHAVRYIAVAAAAKKSPVRIEVVQPQWQPAARSDIDWLVLAPRIFLAAPALTRLMQHRQSQGLHPAGVAVEDIFAYLNQGRRSPLAIKAFLQWAVQRWPLTWVLLAGDGSYQRRPVQGDTLDLVPVYMRQTLNYGAASSDHWYSLLAGEDEIPDLLLGRLPARTPEQLETVVDKIIAHETNAESGAWHNRLLFIGGNGSEFRSKGQALVRQVPSAWSPAMLFTLKDPALSPDPFYGSTPELLDFMDQGCGVINFHGHGGGAIWSDDALMGLEDVAALHNQGRYPLILSMTCFTGAFEEPAGANLAETMLFTAEKGTMAFLGASGFGWRDNDDELQAAIMAYLYDHPAATLGEVVTAGKIRYYAGAMGSAIAHAEINQYTLFGDPAQRLRLPAAQAEVALETPLLAAGDTLKARVQWPFASGSATVQIELEPGRAAEVGQLSVATGQSDFRLALPTAGTGGRGIVRFYGVDALGLQQSHGAAAFSFGRGYFDSLRVLPGAADSLNFLVQLRSRDLPAAVFCLFRGDTLAMRTAGSGWYRLTVKSWGVPRLACEFLARFADGDALLSSTYTYTPSGRMNVEALTNRLSWGGGERPILYLPLMNWGNGAGTVSITLEQRDAAGEGWHRLAADTVAMAACAGATAAFTVLTDPGEWPVRFLLDSGQASRQETRVQITPPVFALDPGAGFHLQAGGADTLWLDARTACIASSRSVRKPATLRVERRGAAQITDQPDFSASPTIPVYALELAPADAVDQGILLSLAAAATDSLPASFASADLFYFAPATRKWVRLASRKEESRIAATISQSGLYTLLWSADSRAPEMEVAFDGRPFAADAWVNSDAAIALRLRDANGIDLAAGKTELTLDGQPLERESWSLPDSMADGNLIPLTLHPELQPGRHTLLVTTSDCSGNAAPPQEFPFQVAEHFSLNLLGTYPNPFTVRTTFVYLLSSSADHFSLKIYTAAGRLIRQFNGRNSEDPDPLSADYHEITWDGKDEEGMAVANGVYFYRLTARSGDKSEEKTGKIARLL